MTIKYFNSLIHFKVIQRLLIVVPVRSCHLCGEAGVVSDIPVGLCGISQHSGVKSMRGNQGNKWSSAGRILLASLLPEEVLQNWFPHRGKYQGRLLRGKSALGKGNQGSAACPANAYLGEPGLLLSHFSFFPVSSLGERKSVYLGLENTYRGIAIRLCFRGSHAPRMGGRD